MTTAAAWLGVALGLWSLYARARLRWRQDDLEVRQRDYEQVIIALGRDRPPRPG